MRAESYCEIIMSDAPRLEPETIAPEAWLAEAAGRAAWECWGKGRPTGGWPAHPLLCHLLDVAAVARHLLTTRMPAALRRRLLAIGGPREDASMALLLFVIALHDLGKYTPAFQAKLDWARRRCHCTGSMSIRRQPPCTTAKRAWNSSATRSVRLESRRVRL
jgi:hypothetical protein